MVAGLLLTGGSSRRMGRDKAELVVAGERLADHAARVLTAVCEPVLEIGPGRSELEAVGDDDPGGGPLVGLVTGSRVLRERGHEGPVLLLGVDLPFVDQRVLELLAHHPASETVVPRTLGVRQSCCARYAPRVLDMAAEFVERGERALHSLLSAVPVVEVQEEEWRAIASPEVFADLDTPEDLARFGVDGTQ